MHHIEFDQAALFIDKPDVKQVRPYSLGPFSKVCAWFAKLIQAVAVDMLLLVVYLVLVGCPALRTCR